MNTPLKNIQVKTLPKGFTPTGHTPNRQQRRSKEYLQYIQKMNEAILKGMSTEGIEKELESDLQNKLEQ